MGLLGKKDRDEETAPDTSTQRKHRDVNPPERRQDEVTLPAKQAPMHLNRETAQDPDQAVNPHNEALAQRPVEDANERLRDAELAEKDSPLSKLEAWKQRTFLGGPRDADWQEFDELIAEIRAPKSRARK